MQEIYDIKIENLSNLKVKLVDYKNSEEIENENT